MAERLLTDADVEAIANAVKGHSHCNLGLTEEQANTLKRFLKAYDSACSTVGKTIVTASVGLILGIVGLGFWAWLGSGLKTFFVSK